MYILIILNISKRNIECQISDDIQSEKLCFTREIHGFEYRARGDVFASNQVDEIQHVYIDSFLDIRGFFSGKLGLSAITFE